MKSQFSSVDARLRVVNAGLTAVFALSALFVAITVWANSFDPPAAFADDSDCTTPVQQYPAPTPSWGLEGGPVSGTPTPWPNPTPTESASTADTQVFACVDTNQLRLVVVNGDATKNDTDSTSGSNMGGNPTSTPSPSYPGPPNWKDTMSQEIDGKMILFNEFEDDSYVPFGDHVVTLWASSASGAATLSLNVHSSQSHGIATGDYEGNMICVDFCSKSSDLGDPQTYIARNSEQCAYNGDITHKDPEKDGSGQVVAPNPPDDPTHYCILDENSWGFKLAQEFPQDYKPVPHESEPPYPILNGFNLSTIPSGGQTLEMRVNYAARTTKKLRPGLYGATTFYTLIPLP